MEPIAASLELVFLGTGTSAGVPMIGCDCRVCRSDDPRDSRSRPSVLVRYPVAVSGETGTAVTMRQILVDASPELRSQAVGANIARLDAVVLTHAHADHVLGIDDLRRFNAVMRAPLDLYAEPAVIDQLRRMFHHIFASHTNVNPSFVAQLIATPIEAGRTFDLHGARWTPIRLMHGRLAIVGYRVDVAGQSLAYCTDVSSIPPDSYRLLEGVDLLVLDGLRYRHHPTHLSIDQALEVIHAIGPGKAYLTHMAHDVSHAELAAALPEGVEPAYDGLRVRLGDPADQADAPAASRIGSH